jgi:CHAD domain-containing protein
MSAAERVIMEVLYGVPQFDSYEEGRLLMARLTMLRPRVVQNMLKKCASVKVKRLFMLLAENCEHAWVKKVDLSRVDFGKGKRTLVKGGRFHPKYRITVPNTETARTASETRAPRRGSDFYFPTFSPD